MFDPKSVLAMLLLTAPMAALAGCAASPIAPDRAERDSAAPVAASAAELSGFDLETPRMHVFLLTTPFQVLVSDEQVNAELMPVIAVQATSPVLPEPAAEISCGLAGIARSIAHPAGIWREVAPLHADSNTDACVRAAAAIEHLPEALAPVRWYQ